MNIRMIFITFSALFLAIGAAQATPVKVEFQGVQFAEPGLIRGATNELGIYSGGLVMGSFVFDTAGAIDAYYASDPLKGQYYGVISKSRFGLVSRSGDDFYLSYYLIDTEAHNVQFYASTFLNGVYEILSLSLDVKPGVITNDQFHLSALTSSDLNSGTWGFQRTHFDVSGTFPPVVIYGGFQNTLISVTDLQPTSNIPEPNLLALLCISVVGIAVSRKRALNRF